MLQTLIELWKQSPIQTFIEFDVNRSNPGFRDVVITVKMSARGTARVHAIYLDTCGRPMSQIGITAMSEGLTASDHISIDSLTLENRSYSAMTITAKNWWMIDGATVHWHFTDNGVPHITKCKKKSPWNAKSVVK